MATELIEQLDLRSSEAIRRAEEINAFGMDWNWPSPPSCSGEFESLVVKSRFDRSGNLDEWDMFRDWANAQYAKMSDEQTAAFINSRGAREFWMPKRPWLVRFIETTFRRPQRGW